MGKANLTGEARDIPDSPLLKHESRHLAEGVDCTVQEVPVWSKPEEKEEKLLINWLIDGNPYPMFLNPSVTKGSTRKVGKKEVTYDNSKAYDTLTKLNLMRDFEVWLKDREEFDNSEFASFLNERISGVKAEVEVKNSNRGKENETSAISKVIELEE